MALISEERVWNMVAGGAAGAAALVARRALDANWRRIRGQDPPRNPASSEVGWGDAVAWTIAAGVTVGVARLVARRGVAACWRSLVGRDPEPLT